MKVVLIYRRPRAGGYSIENLFLTVSAELRATGIFVSDYQVSSWLRIPFDLYKLGKIKADIYHVTGDVNYWVLLLIGRKTVLTVHDIGHYLFGLKGWHKLVYELIWLRMPIFFATKVTVVSQFTEESLITHLRIPGKTLKVVENCYHPRFTVAEENFDSNCPRILQIGTGENKNINRLVQALSGIRCLLVLIGKLTPTQILELEKCKVSFESYNSLSSEELHHQYKMSHLVTFVSTNEGFGMPIIEAQAMGKPLVTSNIPPMSLVAGNGACLADPFDVDSIRSSILRLINDPSFRAKTVSCGLSNVYRYKAKTVAKRYLQLYSDILKTC